MVEGGWFSENSYSGEPGWIATASASSQGGSHWETGIQVKALEEGMDILRKSTRARARTHTHTGTRTCSEGWKVQQPVQGPPRQECANSVTDCTKALRQRAPDQVQGGRCGCGQGLQCRGESERWSGLLSHSEGLSCDSEGCEGFEQVKNGKLTCFLRFLLSPEETLKS